ncbi:MAG: RdgB/HAM1 family non-canonical purine NTP pyrophosphatase [Elusimicrobiota bacterium]|nr:RdgB/HAM1 family non-canonical purine NTP pyrophosphatase [Elusimicrobiota bacterium]
MKLVLATRNAHKVSEIARLLAGTGVQAVPADAVPGAPEVDEDQPTLEGNAVKKARELAAYARAWALADDTGLEVDALGGAPGVVSARWAGPGCSYEDNCRKLLAEMAGRTARAARFRTVMALSSPDGTTRTVEGRLEGAVAEAPRGTNGFGYDPVFVLPDGRTLAELDADEKNALSHRGHALRAILPLIKRSMAALLVCLSWQSVFSARPCRAEKTEPGSETVWDQIMKAQARRDLRQGHRLLEEKKYDLALAEMKRAVAVSPKDPVAHALLGVAQYWNGLVDESISSYRTSLALDPENAQTHLLLGISQAFKNDGPAAAASFAKAAKLDPTRADAQMNLGSIRETEGDYPAALVLFRQAVELDGKNPLYRFQLGGLYRKLGRDAEAVEQFAEAVKLEPSYEDALLELGCAHERLKDRKAAMSALKRAVGLKPGDSVARLRWARLLIEAGDRKRARSVMAEAFHLTPEAGGPGLQLSVAYSGGKKAAPGSPEPSKSPAPAEPEPQDPLSVFERNLRRVPLDQGAVMHLDAVFIPKPKLVKSGPGAESSSLKKALARAQGGGADGAGAPKAVRRDFPLRPSGAAEREAEVRRIMDDLRKVMADAPPDADARLGMNLTLTRPVDAGRTPSDAPSKVSFQPRDVGNDMGLWVMGTGWMALAAEVLPEPGEAPGHPDDADWWAATGLAYAAVGESQKAMGAFLRATELDASSVPGWLGRGVAAVMAGDEAAAASALRKVLLLDPKNKAATQGLKWLLTPAVKG